MLLLVLNKWAKSCSQASVRTKTFAGQTFSGLFSSITGLPLKKKKKWLKATKSKTQALGRQFAATSAQITRTEKKQGPHCPEGHFLQTFILCSSAILISPLQNGGKIG